MILEDYLFCGLEKTEHLNDLNCVKIRNNS